MSEIPIFKDYHAFSKQPISYLMNKKSTLGNSANFYIEHHGFKFIVLNDSNLFEEVLTNEEYFGDPTDQPNMKVTTNVFGIPPEIAKRNGVKTVKRLRQFINQNALNLATSISNLFLKLSPTTIPVDMSCDLYDFCGAVFWPMSICLFTDSSETSIQKFMDYRQCPHQRTSCHSTKDIPTDSIPNPTDNLQNASESSINLYQHFNHIDENFGTALRDPNLVPNLRESVNGVVNFLQDLMRLKLDGPVLKFYESILNGEDLETITRYGTGAWWGGLGNTLPGTFWTIAYILDRPDVHEHVVRDCLEASETPFIIRQCLAETLRLVTFSVAWRQKKKDKLELSPVLNQIPVGTSIGVFFATRHYDPNIWVNPSEFDPYRFTKDNIFKAEYNNHKFAWTPFSFGVHKCSGYRLAIEEIPQILFKFFKHFHVEKVDENCQLPPFNFKQAFGIINPDLSNALYRVRIRRRSDMKSNI